MKNRLETAEKLKEILADEYVIYTKARNYHWNVTGEHFYGLHAAFEEIYNTLAIDIDELAEKIRSLGGVAPGSMKEFIELSTLQEKVGAEYPAVEMVNDIISDFEVVIDKAVVLGKEVQDKYGDELTAGLLYGMADKYEKTNWMLKSTVK